LGIYSIWWRITNTQSGAEPVQVIVLKGEDLICPVYSTMRGPLIDLAGIREEPKRIGRNINQITHAFHLAETDSQKVFYALRVAEQYKTVDERVERLLEVVTELAKKWLSGDYEKKVKIEIRLADFEEGEPKGSQESAV
jgi:hypothetical protein